MIEHQFSQYQCKVKHVYFETKSVVSKKVNCNFKKNVKLLFWTFVVC